MMINWIALRRELHYRNVMSCQRSFDERWTESARKDHWAHVLRVFGVISRLRPKDLGPVLCELQLRCDLFAEFNPSFAACPATSEMNVDKTLQGLTWDPPPNGQHDAHGKKAGRFQSLLTPTPRSQTCPSPERWQCRLGVGFVTWCTLDVKETSPGRAGGRPHLYLMYPSVLSRDETPWRYVMSSVG